MRSFCLQIVFVFKSPLTPGNEGMTKNTHLWLPLTSHIPHSLSFSLSYFTLSLPLLFPPLSPPLLSPSLPPSFSPSLLLTAMGAHQTLHGDGVKDIAFSVEDCRSLYKVSRWIVVVVVIHKGEGGRGD